MSPPPVPSSRSPALPALIATLLLGCGGVSPGPSAPAGAARVEPVLVDVPEHRFDGRIPVASIFPWIGRYAGSGIQSTLGARMAVDELNLRGPVHGRSLALLEYRTGSYFVDVRHASELAVGAGALAIVGSNSSGLSLEVADRAEAAGIVQVSNVSTAQDLTWDPGSGRERDFVFRVCGTDFEIGALLADFARERLSARRVAVLYELGRTYSARMARVFAESFQDPDAGRRAGEFPYIAQETDFRPHLRRVLAFAPDALFVPGSFTDATLIAEQAERLGLRATLLGADGWSNRLLFNRGGPPGDAYYGDLCAMPAEFRERYRRRFREAPDGCRALLAYDAVLALHAALQELGPLEDADLREGIARTRKRLRDALAAVDVPGAAGRLRFDRHGDIQRGIAVMRVSRSGAGVQARFDSWLGER